ncbi:MAG: aminotransferase class I/II-fold pyridoxal phosphate-dependent enzyme, partial [Planctomycetia bacterium]|nr:aminotransferase class I/II-fold pyridoxal phosphate-dependent enzyme [Planctomycetia bacterium]
FTYGEARHFSAGSIPGSAGHTISLYSLSKAYGFASWRIGWMVFPTHLESAMRKVQDTILICSPVISQFAAIGALQNGRAYAQEKLKVIAESRAIAQAALGQLDGCVVPRADGDKTVFLTNGNGPPGSTGRLLRSRDYGATFEDAGLPGTLNSTPWTVATHPSDPKLIFVCSNLGQAFRSTDGGESWTRLAREFGEVRSTIWQPLP